jgi:plastocyanin
LTRYNGQLSLIFTPTSMNESTLPETFGIKTKVVQISRSNWASALLHWTLVLAALMVPQVLRAQWHVIVGAQSGDEGRQALAFLPNEIWIHAGDNVTWAFDAGEIHTVTFLKANQVRPSFAEGCPGFSTSPATFDGTTCVSTTASVEGAANFTVIFPAAGDFKVVCLVHENMTGVIHVLDRAKRLPHDQDFYDRQAAVQRRDLLSDTDGERDRKRYRHEDCNFAGHLVTAGIGETSATAGGAAGSSVFRFKHDKIEIHAGQTVEWNNQDPVIPHTITFGTEPPPNDLFPPSSNVTPDAEGVLHAVISLPTDSVHSGFIIAAPQERIGVPQAPLGTTRFRVTFKKPGFFPYICALHDDLGMKGTVIVYP